MSQGMKHHSITQEKKQIFQLFNKAAPFSALKWIWLKEKLHCQKKM